MKELYFCWPKLTTRLKLKRFVRRLFLVYPIQNKFGDDFLKRNALKFCKRYLADKASGNKKVYLTY